MGARAIPNPTSMATAYAAELPAGACPPHPSDAFAALTRSTRTTTRGTSSSNPASFRIMYAAPTHISAITSCTIPWCSTREQRQEPRNRSRIEQGWVRRQRSVPGSWEQQAERVAGQRNPSAASRAHRDKPCCQRPHNAGEHRDHERPMQRNSTERLQQQEHQRHAGSPVLESRIRHLQMLQLQIEQKRNPKRVIFCEVLCESQRVAGIGRPAERYLAREPGSQSQDDQRECGSSVFLPAFQSHC